MNGLQVIERENQRVMTTAFLAEEYGTTVKMMSNNFNNNKDRYTERKHYYYLEGEELKEFLQSTNLGMQNADKIRSLYLWTEKGALLHAKSLGTDRAWEVYEILVDTYFKKQVDLLEGLSTEMKGVMMLDRKFQDMGHRIGDTESRVDKLENTMTINHEQQREITNLKSKRVMAICGGYKSDVYNAISGEVFRALGHDYKEYFKINAYGNTPVARLGEAEAYIRNWQPSNNLQIEISRVSKEVFENRAS